MADEFERRVVDAVAALPVGDPPDPATRVGPLARADLLDALERQVEDPLAGGAKVLLGGARLERPGWYYAPTVLAGVTPDLPVFTEETFGPVAAVVRAPDEEAAVELANDTPRELAAVGIREFTNIRTFWVQPADAAPPATLTE